jgi:ATP phosphoribosyltransferase
MPWQEMHINNKGRQTMKKYIITEYPGLIRQYVVEGKNNFHIKKISKMLIIILLKIKLLNL